MKKDLGILMHISSLPSKYGVGTLGKEAYEFVDFLKQNKLNLWQILPLNVTSFGDSPYQSPSNFGLNYYFIDLDILINKGLLKEEEISSIKFFDTLDRVNYEYQYNNRLNVLRIAYNRFDKSNKKFNTFLKRKDYRDFAFFMVLKRINNGRPWYQFDDEYKTYSKKLETKIIKDYNDEFNFYMWTQFEFLNQFKALKRYANKNNIKIMGDMPIYVAYDSVECYKYPSMFQFNEFKEPINVAGCPPDAFSATGQLWGNPIYDYDKMEKDDFAWWIKRTKKAFEYFDIVRIDHFRGFAGYYTIPYGDKTAEKGKWEKGVGIKLFKKIEAELGKKNFIAEDLGVIDDDVRKLLKSTGYPGMKIIQFAFEGRMDHEYLPINYEENCVAYPGTHDNPTLKEWLEEIPQWQKEFCYKYLKLRKNENPIRKIIKVLQESKANLVIIPLQDYLELGKESRINTPSTLGGNWQYRFSPKVFSKGLINKITSLCKVRIRGK